MYETNPDLRYALTTVHTTNWLYIDHEILHQHLWQASPHYVSDKDRVTYFRTKTDTCTLNFQVTPLWKIATNGSKGKLLFYLLFKPQMPALYSIGYKCIFFLFQSKSNNKLSPFKIWWGLISDYVTCKIG